MSRKWTLQRILNVIRSSIPAHSKQAGFVSSKSDDALARMVVKNYRGSIEAHQTGVSLTYQGFLILSEIFRSYEVVYYGDYRFIPTDLMFLEETVELPFYYTMRRKVVDGKPVVSQHIYCFDANFATLLQMYDGDVRLMRG